MVFKEKKFYFSSDTKTIDYSSDDFGIVYMMMMMMMMMMMIALY